MKLRILQQLPLTCYENTSIAKLLKHILLKTTFGLSGLTPGKPFYLFYSDLRIFRGVSKALKPEISRKP